ncbi:MAG: flavodoxin reductase [Flavobacteriales bacterium]|nr:flavodoxin reductase [Flavobacteriales bacterium]
MEHEVELLNKEQVTHDVVRLTMQRPEGYRFIAGQAIEFGLDRPGMQGKRSPFTLTGLDSDEHLTLMIKCYPQHHGMTERIAQLKVGDRIIISDAWDTVKLQGPGVFVAGGTGMTPFIAILRQKKVDRTLAGNTLFFFNKKREDVFLEDELKSLLGPEFHSVLSEEEAPGHLHGMVSAELFKQHLRDADRPFYVCGPEGFVKAVQGALTSLGVQEKMLDLHF